MHLRYQNVHHRKLIDKNSPLSEQLGLNAFKLFGNYKMALFFLFSMLLGAALQLQMLMEMYS
jgi:NHS family xanthosine MFS transporter